MKIIILVIMNVAFGAQITSAEALKMVRCSNQKVVRLIEIQKNNQGGCETVYTKDGVSRVEGTGQNMEGCELILGNIEKNLTKAWWKCADISKNVEVVQ